MIDKKACALICFFFQAEDGIRDLTVTGVQTCALPISPDDEGEHAARGRPSRERSGSRSRYHAALETLDRPRARWCPASAGPQPPGRRSSRGFAGRSHAPIFTPGRSVASTGYRVAGLVGRGRGGSRGLEHARGGRRVRVRPGGSGLLALGDLAAEFGRRLGWQRGAHQRPDLRLLELDVLAGVHDELAEQLLELAVVRAELVQAGQHLLGVLLLPGRLVGQRVTGPQAVPYGGPEVHLLQRLVPRLLDDQLLGHLLAPRHRPNSRPRSSIACCRRRCPPRGRAGPGAAGPPRPGAA